MASYFNIVPLNVRQEIRELDLNVGEERNSLSDSKLLEDFGRCVLDSRHTRGRNNQFLNLVALHCKMKTLLSLVLRGKKLRNTTSLHP